MIKYHLAYWKGYWAELATKKGVEIISTAPHMQYVIENLEPYTKYYIQVLLFYFVFYTFETHAHL